MSEANIRRGGSTLVDEEAAVKEFYATVNQADTALAVFFCSPSYNLNKIANALNAVFSDITVMGCTTAGEIGANGYTEHSITGFSLGKSGFNVAVSSITELADVHLMDGKCAVKALQQTLSRESQIAGDNCFGFLLVDGLSVKEEILISGLYSGVGDLQIFGGSAGDGLDFRQTFVFFNGEFVNDCAVVALIQTEHPFTVFKTQHYVESDRKLVVTEALPEKRIVTEINGEAAGEEYARLVGCQIKDLNPSVFAQHPLVLKSGRASYVRSIQNINSDGSLTFYCAIDEGIVLTVAEGKDLKENLLATMQDVRNRVGEPELIISCDCILRRLEMSDKSLLGEVGDIMRDNNAVGFSTYGEQYHSMHVNQTLTGVAIGKSA